MIHHNGDFYPDVFLAGAPKSGTTFLFNRLAAHSVICASNPKETDYFLDPNNPNKKSDRTLAKNPYPDHYDSLADGLVHLDGSVWTIYQTELAGKMKTLGRKPKILFILREPARRILSSFQYTSNNLSAVKNLSFSQYVECLMSSEIDIIEKACKSKTAAFSLQNELSYSKYSIYLDKWREAVGVENMKIFLFEDLKADPDLCYKQVCDFLGLETEELEVDFDEKNQSVVIKNRFVHYFLHRAFSLVGFKVPFKQQLKRIYSRLQHTEAAKVNYDKDLSKLKAYYRPFNEKLSTDYQLDLKAWK
ncbi:MAG: sulfotransferase [Roseivirga sp.]|nr:sulfotransferase [Roseivirga sp.]